MTSFDLTCEPWIPVRRLDGAADLLGLADLVRRAPEIRELAIAFPLEYVATLRIVVTVVQAAARGPATTEERVGWLENHGEVADRVDDYLARWRERFDAFHPTRPFMQAPVGDDTAPSTVAQLRADWAAGNNVTLFDHHVDSRPEALLPGNAVRALLTTLLFQPGGGVSKPFNRTDSPATKGLQVIVDGEHLWESIVLNAPQADDRDMGVPAWERPEHDADRAKRVGTHPDGWLDRATWRSRAVRLLRDDDGLVRHARMHQHLKLPDGLPPADPYVPVRREPGKPPAVVRASPAKAIWRDAEAVFRGIAASEQEHPHVLLSAFDALDFLDRDGAVAVRVVGQIVNQAKIADVRDARLPLSRTMLESSVLLSAVAALSATGEEAAKALRVAIHFTVTQRGAGDGWALARRWEVDFWASLAPAHHEALEAVARLGDDELVAIPEVVAGWRQRAIRAARTCFDRFEQDGARGRAPAAYGAGRARLDRGLAKLQPTKEPV